MPPLQPSSPSQADEVFEALMQASDKGDVRAIYQRYDADDIQRAWSRLPPAQRGALLLVRFTDGRIFHELDNTN